MTPQEKFEDLMKGMDRPNSLVKVPTLISSLLSDSDLRIEVAKEVEDMSDKVLFFYQNEVVFMLSIPWHLSLEDRRKDLTERYKYKLKEK
jgi:hypothetical protein